MWDQSESGPHARSASRAAEKDADERRERSAVVTQRHRQEQVSTTRTEGLAKGLGICSQFAADDEAAAVAVPSSKRPIHSAPHPSPFMQLSSAHVHSIHSLTGTSSPLRAKGATWRPPQQRACPCTCHRPFIDWASDSRFPVSRLSIKLNYIDSHANS